MVCVKCGKNLDAVDLYEILFKFAEYFDRCIKCQTEPILEKQNHQTVSGNVSEMLIDTAM